MPRTGTNVSIPAQSSAPPHALRSSSRLASIAASVHTEPGKAKSQCITALVGAVNQGKRSFSSTTVRETHKKAKMPVRLEPTATPRGNLVSPNGPSMKPEEVDPVDHLALHAQNEDLPPLLSEKEIRLATTMKRSRMTYSFEDARQHLEEADVRFRSMFATVDMTRFKPYFATAQDTPDPASSQEDDQWNMMSGKDDAEAEQDRANGVEVIDLFRTMTTSIIGQQISWKAAKAVIWRFCSIFHPELGDMPYDQEQYKATLVFPTPLQVLSQNPRRFRDAGLSEAKARAVVDVARRFADGRLNVRRLSAASTEECTAELVDARGVGPWTAHMVQLFALREPDVLPVGDLAVQRGMVDFFLADRTGPKIARKQGGLYERDSPPPDIYTRDPPEYPQGIKRELLMSRRGMIGSKRKYFLSPEQMEQLTEPWRPYRSVASLLMWCVVDEGGKKPASGQLAKVKPSLEPTSQNTPASTAT